MKLIESSKWVSFECDCGGAGRVGGVCNRVLSAWEAGDLRVLRPSPWRPSPWQPQTGTAVTSPQDYANKGAACTGWNHSGVTSASGWSQWLEPFKRNQQRNNHWH